MPVVLDKCTAFEYYYKRYKPMTGTNCASFCQCAPLSLASNGKVTYYWAPHTCPTGTLFDVSIKVCNHANKVACGSGTEAHFVWTVFHN